MVPSGGGFPRHWGPKQDVAWRAGPSYIAQEVASRTPRGGRDGLRPGLKRLALLVGMSLSLAVAMPSMADEPPSSTESWRASRLRPNALHGVSDGIAAGNASWATGMGAAGAEGTGPDTAADTRLMLQLGMLLALLYVAFLCLWLSTRRRRQGLGDARHRVRASCAALANSAVIRARSVTQRAPSTPSRANSPWTCEIAWKPATCGPASRR
jgi:hypothetical protein